METVAFPAILPIVDVLARHPANGEVRNVDVVSGDRSILNRAAIKTVERLSGEFPQPDEPITLQVPINYRLQ